MFKSLVFLAVCLAVAESQNNNGYNNNNNYRDGYGNNGGGGGYTNNDNNNGGYNSNGGSNRNGGGGFNNNNGNGGNNNGGGNNMNNNRNGGGFCKGLEKRSRSVTFNCTTSNGDVASCTDRVLSGTKAKLGCKRNYVVQDETMIPEMTCLNGQWNRELKAFKCLSVPIAVGYNYTTGIGFYKFYKSGRSWMEAKKICENDGGHLLVIDTPEERDAANASLSGLPRNVRVAGARASNKTKGSRSGSTSQITTSADDLMTIYIGYSDTVTDGTMASVTNGSMTVPWCDAARSEKSIAIKKKAKNCAAMRPGSLCATDHTCNLKRSFICEIEPTTSTEADSSSATTRAS